ncbi:hypothetical protein QFC21_002626 [Naganishia friedmannii]|uniref:Uncharacterized protein n=1 Tax=Naganishia friedmannii TaxID=89922 RepID=A0ACC2VVN6_9TREE|nr:hypothetical protein QFC21_002626 [Naganishia friedmannii]
MSAMQNTISFPSAPELVHRSFRFDDKFGGEPGLTAQQLALFIKYTLLTDPTVKQFQFSACVKAEYRENVADWKITPLLSNQERHLTIRMNEMEVEYLFMLLSAEQLAHHHQWTEQGIECKQVYRKYSRIAYGLPKYTIAKAKPAEDVENSSAVIIQAEQSLPPLPRNFGSVCLHQFPVYKPEPFIPDSDDEDAEEEEKGSKKDILYI